MNRNKLVVVWLLSATLTACSGDGTGYTPVSGQKSGPELEVVTYELKVHLPKCNSSRQGQVYYVRDEDQFYYCDGRRLKPVELSGSPGEDGTSWITELSEAGPDVCPAGGTVIGVGPDDDGDGRLDDEEVVSHATVCNGQDGADGQDGIDGQDGQDGQDGTSCTVTDNGDGTKTVECDDGTSVTISDGADGESGAQGEPGPQGDAGPAGADGMDGGSCSVFDHGNGTKTISCEDGTEVTVTDGEDGETCTIESNEDGSTTITCGDASVTVSQPPNNTQLRIEGDVSVSSQAEVDELLGVVEITGTLGIWGPGDIESLSALSQLGSVGQLVVMYLGQVELVGFPALAETESISIQENPSVTAISMPSLIAATDVIVTGNNALTTVRFPSLIATEHAHLRGESLVDLDMSGMVTAGNLVIYGTGLPDVSGFSRLNHADAIDIAYNPWLEDIALPALRGVDDRLAIYENDTLHTVRLNGAIVGQYVDINHNASLTSVQLPESGTEDLSITECPMLTEFDAPQAGFSRLMLRDTGLTNLIGLSDGATIGSLDLGDNPSLSSLSGLSGLNVLPGSLTISDNDALATLDGLENLEEVGDSLRIRNNPHLSDISALANLRLVFNDLVFSGNGELTSLVGLSGINEVWDVVIDGNDSLSDISQMLDWVTDAVFNSLTIVGNPSLPQCRVDAVEAYLLAPCTCSPNAPPGVCPTP